MSCSCDANAGESIERRFSCCPPFSPVRLDPGRPLAMSAPSPSSTTSLVAPSSSSISALFTSARQQELASAQKPATSRHLHLHVQAHMSNSTGHTATSGQAEMTPIAWDAHFDQRRMVSVPRIPPAKADSVPSSSGDSGPDEFCVYSAQPTSFAALPRPPFVTLLIHGSVRNHQAFASELKMKISWL